MSATPSEILRIWFERVWNQGDEATIDELYGPTAVAYGQPAALTPVVEGRILEGWNAYDFIAMYQQLGIEPPQPV